MTKLFLVLATVMIISSPSHAQLKLNGGADVGASYIVNPDRFTREPISDTLNKLTPNLLNYPVTRWCVSQDGTVFRTLKKERACLRVAVSPKFKQGIACRDANITLEVNRAIPVFQQGADGSIGNVVSWSPAPQVFEILTVDETSLDLSTLGVVKLEPVSIQVCK